MSNSQPLDPSTTSTAKKTMLQLVGFQVGGQDYAFRIEQIQEIVILRQVTKLPQVPSYVDGVANLRGSIIPIINLRLLFGVEPRPSDENTRTIVVNVGTRIMGCVVDSVSQVIRIPEESIQTAPETVTLGAAHYIHGFARADNRLMIVLNINELLDLNRLQELRGTVATLP
jgi:purine-binding chemotaxis protein CheW